MKETMKRVWPFAAILALFVGYLGYDGVQDARYRREVNSKLDTIASDTNAVYERVDILETNVEQHNENNGEIVNTLILDIKDLKDHVEEEIDRIDKHVDEVEQAKKKKKEEQAVYTASSSFDVYSSADSGSGYSHPFRSQGTTSDGNYNYTWYSQRALPGEGLSIPGRHVNEDGFVCDGDGRLCVAIDGMDYGTEIDTPFGKAVVYDHVSPDGSRTGLIDVYTDW